MHLEPETSWYELTITNEEICVLTRVRPESTFGNRNRIPDFSNLHSVIHYRNRKFQIAFRFRLNRNRNFYTWFRFRPEPDKGINRNSGRNLKFSHTCFWCSQKQNLGWLLGRNRIFCWIIQIVWFLMIPSASPRVVLDIVRVSCTLKVCQVHFYEIYINLLIGRSD